MVDLAKLVVAALLACSGGAHAGYAQAVPPTTWTKVGGTGFYQAAANDISFSGGVRGASAVVNVGGRAVTMPAAYRFAANGGATVARFAFANPLAFGVAGAAMLAYQYFTSKGYFLEGGIWKKMTAGDPCTANCYSYRYSVSGASGQFADTPAAAAQSAAAAYNAAPAPGFSVTVDSVNGEVVTMRFIRVSPASNFTQQATLVGKTPRAPSTVMVPAQETDMALDFSPIPSGLPQVLPVPLPVELPILNPSPALNPLPQPLRVPMGEPVAVPNTSPQQYRTPVINIIPSPVIGDEWRVDVQPADVTKTDPAPLPDGGSTPAPSPSETTSEKTPDLCEKNPGILACQKPNLGSLSPVAVVNSERSLSITKDQGWGPSSSACPAPKTVTVMGKQLVMPFTLICDFASAIKPLLIAFAWLTAAMTFFGFSRRD